MTEIKNNKIEDMTYCHSAFHDPRLTTNCKWIHSKSFFSILSQDMKYQTLESRETKPNTESDKSKEGCFCLLSQFLSDSKRQGRDYKWLSYLLL